MTWIEIVRARVVETRRTAALRELGAQLLRLPTRGGLTRVRLLTDTRLETDLSVHLHWSCADVAGAGSAVGRQLAAELGAVGGAHHTIWREEHQR